MATDNTIGGVRIVIEGDTSKLNSDFAKAQAMAASAGAKISSSLEGGMVPGLRGASISFMQMGAAAQSAAVSVNTATESVKSFETVLAEQNAVLALAIQRNMSLAGATERAASAFNAGSSSARILGSELRVLSGQGGILTAERFLAGIPGVMAAANIALPLLGLVAVGEMLSHVAEKFTGMSEAEKKAAEESNKLSQELHKINEETAKINNQNFATVFGATTASGKEIGDITAKIRTQENLIASTKLMIETQEKARKAQDQALAENPELGPSIVRPVDSNLPKLLAIQEATLAQLRASQTTANLDYGGNAVKDKQARADAEEKAEREHVEMLEASAEAQRRVEERQQAKLREDEQIWRAHNSTLKAIYDTKVRDLEEQGREMDEELRKQTESARRAAQERQEVANVEDRSANAARRYLDVAASGAGELQKLQARLEYESKIYHSKEQQLEYTRQIAAIEEQAATAKRDAANADVASAQAALEENPSVDQLLKLQQAITAQKQAQNELDKQALQNAIAIQNATQKGVGAQVGAAGKKQLSDIFSAQGAANALGQVSNDIGNSIADSLLGKHPGKSIGQEMAKELEDTLKNTLKQTLSGIISSVLKIGIGSILGFASGGEPPVGVPSLVGENGPELFVPKTAGTVVPNHMINMGGGTSAPASVGGRTSSNTLSVGQIHLHGVSNPEQMARALPEVLKRYSNKFAPSSLAWSS